MRVRRVILILLCLICAAGVWLFWPQVSRPLARAWTKLAAPHKFFAKPGVTTVRSASTMPQIFPAALCPTNNVKAVAVVTNRFPYRLANTHKSIGELLHDPHAILLENALIDTGAKLNFSIPKSLQSQGDPGAYIVQARGSVGSAFRAELAAAGAQIINYIPNDSYLVTVNADGANAIASSGLAQAVIPFEPYYRVQSSLMQWVDQPLPAEATLTVGLFPGKEQQAIQQIKQTGAQIISQDGDIVHVVPPANWTALAQLTGVHVVEPSYARKLANDLSRVTMGVSANTTTLTNDLNLSGLNVIVEVNDSGIDMTHPDFSLTGTAAAPGSVPPSRVLLDSPISGVDTNGHGTHVAGIIAGNGSESHTLAHPPQGSVTNADFRGKAPLAKLYSVAALSENNFDTGSHIFAANHADVADEYLQEAPALTNALISNNSWVYAGDDSYDLAAASYDAAVRDALPEVTGSQPVLFVFAAGNEGASPTDDGSGGEADTIVSPATAKNVISVGALEQLRNITNKVTALDGTTNAVWKPMTDSPFQVASYSSRGNVGIGTEGTYGRFKPDVVAPGSFVVSTRSSQWDKTAYYNATNYYNIPYDDQLVEINSPNGYAPVSIPQNAAGVVITITPNADSPTPFPNLPIYVALSQNGQPNPADPSTYDFVSSSNTVSIPSDGGSGYLDQIQGGGISITVGNTNNFAVNYDLNIEIITTNDLGNYFTVLSNLNETLGPWYRYESGTSMSAPAVSGVLALMQDFFTNTLHTVPSPALLKAMLINGSRVVGGYTFAVTNTVNDQGWGLVHLTNSLPFSSTNSTIATNTCIFLDDQSPSNSLATGDSHTYTVGLSNAVARLYPLRVTLVWTDPPGDPSAAIKLVNNLVLVVTNLSNGAVYYGNNFAASGNPPFSLPWNTNTPPPVDAVNNVQNIYLAPALGTNYSVTVLGGAVNVNAVSAQTNNIVQDYALVISCGEGEVPNALQVTNNGIVSNPTAGQRITDVTGTNSPLLNQFVGAYSPLLGTNNFAADTNSVFYGTNAVITVGQTNQWHFYIVTNLAMDSAGSVSDVTNAAFITFTPPTLSIPRMGVFADSLADSTKPEADIDLYVSTDPTLTNLNPVAISNCVNGAQVGASVGAFPGAVFNGVALDRGGTEFVVDTNSTHGEVYYVGVKSEDQMASEYGFATVFSSTPFSTTDGNGNVIVHGLTLPVNIPDGSARYPGTTNVLALCLSSATVAQVIVTNQIWHQNFGDLTGTLEHDTVSSVVNNNRGIHNTYGNPPLVYDDTHSGNFPGSIPTDPPGNLRNFVGKSASGVWILNETDNSLTQTGTVVTFDMLIVPHQNGPNYSSVVSGPVQPQSWFYDFIDVPVGVTNLFVQAQDRSPHSPVPSPPYLLLAVKFGSEPTLADTNDIVTVSNVLGVTLIGSISTGPPLVPGRYYFGIYNPDTVPHDWQIKTSLGFDQSAIETVDYVSTDTPKPLLDDAVTYSSIPVLDVPDPTAIQSLNVGLRVDHPRISDLAFTLIAPDGSRYSLMQNRGGTDTNGCGVSIITTNIINVSANGTAQPNTNVINVGETSGTLPITYNFYTAPDQMTVYYGNNTLPVNLVCDTGVTNNPTGPRTITVSFPPPGVAPNSTYLTIVMDQFLSPNRADAWTYTAGGVLTNYYYLTLTEDTALTTTPIKFAPTPFVPSVLVTTNPVEDFGSVAPGDYAYDSMNGNSTPVGAAFNVDANQVTVVNDPTNALTGTNLLALANATISTTLPTIQGDRYALTFFYRGPGIVGWWQGDGNANDALGLNNGMMTNGATFATGVVASAFSFPSVANAGARPSDGPYVNVPDSSLWAFGTNDFTIELWANFNSIDASDPGDPFGGLFIGNDEGSGSLNKWFFALGGGVLEFHINGPTVNGGAGVFLVQAPFTPNTNEWHHLAVERQASLYTIYVDGVPVGSQFDTNAIPNPNAPLTIGAAEGFYFDGLLDEVSIYNRALSDSEVLAIYETGSAGKYDPVYYTDFSPAGSLAEASVTIGGVAVPAVINGSNTVWQNETIYFTATGNGTPVSITGTEPGMLLDTFTLTSEPSDLYYLPEQDMTPLVDANAYGTWQLEVQDDRAGATNNTTLVSWRLEFTYANTNIPAVAFGQLPGGLGQTNSLLAGYYGYYTVNVPTNANYATNILLSASLPVNVFFSTNYLPTITNSGDVDLIPGLTNNTNSPAILSTNGSPVIAGPPYIVRGGTYYLVVQNTNTSTVTFNVEVDFDHGNSPLSSLPPVTFTSVKATASSVQLQWAAASGAQYQVQWANSLASPMNWQTITSPRMTVINGIATFTDNGAQTAPLGAARFYRLVQTSSGGSAPIGSR